MNRWYFECSLAKLSKLSPIEILGSLATQHDHALENLQRESWIEEIHHLKGVLDGIDGAHLFWEYSIPRMGRRADVVIVAGSTVFVVEYKVGAKNFEAADKRQTIGYAMDLINFHEGSHGRRVVPVLLATTADESESQSSDPRFGTPQLLLTSGPKLRDAVIKASNEKEPHIDPMKWANAGYKPTPTIIEAAVSLYAGHNVAEISRSDAGAVNLTTTARTVAEIINQAKHNNEKAIIFVSGVPGSGKTLAGLNIATSRLSQDADENAVFLSGNGPLVKVLRESLANDQVRRSTEDGNSMTKEEATRRASSFIQNVHHFRDEALRSRSAPIERVAVFDEAQRAWNFEKTSQFMRQRRRIKNWTMSEPEFLISVMDRHTDWCVIVCLIGNGQEIHTGEAGISEWFSAIDKQFSHWRAYIPQTTDAQLPDISQHRKSDGIHSRPGLHLSASIRSFRSEHVSAWVDAVLTGQLETSKGLFKLLEDYPIFVSRNLELCRCWLREHAHGTDRVGLVTSSNALRLKPYGIHVKSRVSVTNWFLDWEDDVRSSQALEDVATEFDVQGLELDWTAVCWDANLRFINGAWTKHVFKGSKWNNVKKEANSRYLENAYRVLLTRARQGMVIFVPEGEPRDPTRLPEFYDETYQMLIACGARVLSSNPSN